MKTLFSSVLLFCFASICLGQNSAEIIGSWTFTNVTSTDASCKSVDYFPIQTFKFNSDGGAEFKSGEGLAKAKFRVKENSIELYDLSENGVKQDGSAEFKIKQLTSTILILTVAYECGSIDVHFKK
tara:strand:- start:71 stop:448 length:378 start_codon:yes stop_codon:yes gene_type:complete